MSAKADEGELRMPSVARGNAEVGPPPPFDAECVSALTMVLEMYPEPATAEKLPRMRQAATDSDPTDESLECGGAFRVEELSAPGLNGAPDVPVLICTPTAATHRTAAIYYVHGGGMVCGNLRSELDYMMGTAEREGLAIVAVGYRVAPEHPDPAPVEDCYAGLLWLFAQAERFNIDAERILIVGMSAGGGLAAGVALMARDRNGPNLIGQMLHSPMLDERNDTVSSLQFQAHGSWTRESNEFGWSALLGDRRRSEYVSAYASPSRAETLSGLPPTFVDVGSAEVFRDESVDYASRLWAAGGIAELHVWPGGYHGYEAFAPTAAISRGALGARSEWLHRLLN
ncbi:alpha/beta hydrolase [Aeromicrobium wangtongii]|uniref:Alpha/beta hydrolase n=1 Tax=Aeromicrobium wangtongii TaxID=2969247 RepID=A0ABY5MB92_9ACTN|nr:alpha/beta hydrolase [Aeromicrobium wangtongii]MCD9197916.1 alpha/beta hydrolase [Aeromicrobium wangtongii]UUP15394.1 alpha/beta hydrolase [Aeromicrobium wangtongii]